MREPMTSPSTVVASAIPPIGANLRHAQIGQQEKCTTTNRLVQHRV